MTLYCLVWLLTWYIISERTFTVKCMIDGIETESQLTEFIDSQLREFTVRLERAAFDVQSAHHRTYDTPHERKKRSSLYSYPHAYTYNTGAGNREEVSIVDITTFQEYGVNETVDVQYFHYNGLYWLSWSSPDPGASAIHVYDYSSNEFISLALLEYGTITSEPFLVNSKWFDKTMAYVAFAVSNVDQNSVTIFGLDDMTLVQQQVIDCGKVVGMKSITIGSNMYLMLAVEASSGAPQISSLYKWHARSELMFHVQDLTAAGAVDVEDSK
ncbi:uncharacterized protein LOC102810108 [Saccoglossus kowalevskii]|uniref:Uncharacterized protein LOC102810108 n=1 Tax=Saccoglossus kowalevskii TaxID=10224 RepID=A0ABM0MN97_SACKO|nr:PREDICTED: uncharacterized protein LOC102810108 [Saccoglossus kowalevskii]